MEQMLTSSVLGNSPQLQLTRRLTSLLAERQAKSFQKEVKDLLPADQTDLKDGSQADSDTTKSNRSEDGRRYMELQVIR